MVSHLNTFQDSFGITRVIQAPEPPIPIPENVPIYPKSNPISPSGGPSLMMKSLLQDPVSSKVVMIVESEMTLF